MKRLSEKQVEKLLKDVLNQTQFGNVKIKTLDGDSWKFYVDLQSEYSTKENNGHMALVINHKATFIKKLLSYLKLACEFYNKDQSYFNLNDESFAKKLILDLFVNATNFDLNNIEKYIELRTEMLQGQSLEQDVVIGEYMGCEIKVNVSKTRSNLEGPYKFGISIEKDGEKFNLPSLMFGLINDKVYLYSIQGKKRKTNQRAI